MGDDTNNNNTRHQDLEDLLRQAVMMGPHESRVQKFLDQGANVNGEDNYGQTAMHWACRYGYFRISKVLMEHGANLNPPNNEYGPKPLHLACGGGHLEVGQMLIDNGADVQAQDVGGRTPLYWACQQGHLEVVQLLLTRGANVHTTTNGGETPLLVAAKRNHHEVVAFLVRQHPSLVVS